MTATMIHTSAPGKLFLMGEYAVLEGAPALLTAVDRRARVQLRPIDGPDWRISAPNLGVHDQPLGPDGRLPADADADLSRHLAVFDAVRTTVSAHVTQPLPALAVHIDTTDFARDGHKLGLGSSAAVAVALTQALAAAAGQSPDRATLTRLAVAAHRRAQNGTGSGGDVAVSVYGGFIGYVRDQAPTPLDWPETLTGRAVVTGQGASTPELVARVYAYRARDPDRFHTDMTRLAALAERVGSHVGEAARFLDTARDYFDALIALDTHAEAGIVSARHHELAALAARYHTVFKSSGAGGGDVGLLFAHAEDLTNALIVAFETAGAAVLDLVFGAPGVCFDTPSPVDD
ncbi:mevalonate kinase [Salinisphaera sp. Q1T1-3]|uniref:mevalonate kinase family protein n=1 Tax=Salinisphaera sp. Q1T1-3 TaxID=2321229 RepID=UPI0011C4A9FE|nr:hypothetical protein [Salinisphaera sp. Q1T1-3]